MSIPTLPYSELAHNLPQLAILPVGCYEQHGPVLPLDTDSLIAEAAAARLGEALNPDITHHRFPVLPYTTTEPNVNYTGTVSVAADPFRAYLREVCQGILHSGFPALLLLNAHGSIVGSLKEIAFELVMSQYRDPSVSVVRPVLVLNVFDFDSDISELFGQQVGRHADWKEFLLLYGLLGEEYFHSERMERLREFQRGNRFDQCMPGVIGIPAEFRTTDGVQGAPLPRAQDYAEAAEKLWSFVVDKLSNKLVSELDRFKEYQTAGKQTSKTQP